MLLTQNLYHLGMILLVLLKLSSCQNSCLNGGILVIRPAPSLLEICICQKDFIGRICELRIDSLSATDKLKYGCELSPCYAGSTCEDRPFGNFVCHCVANRFGDYCELSSLTNNDPCSSRPCFNGGTCIRQESNSFKCSCPSSYTGPACKTSLLGACASSPCQKDGICVPFQNGTNDFKCQCPDFTIGKNCEALFNPCSRVKCQNNGICQNKRTLAYECNCPSQWIGPLCNQLSSVSCQTIPCAYGTCMLNTNGEYSCSCITEGYEGIYCELEKCNPKCKNNGVCQKHYVNGTYFCQCRDGYEGPDCTLKTQTCFPRSTWVETLNRGRINVSDLIRGDLVKSFDLNLNKWVFSRFVFFLHKDEQTIAQYISIKTIFKKNLKISPMHLIPKRINQKDIEFVFARDLKLNDILISENDQNETIIDIIRITEQGAYAPLLESGTISVNNLLASCYANTKLQSIVHFAFQPVIQLSNFYNMENNNSEKSLDEINWYASLLYSILQFIPMSSKYFLFI